MKYKVKVTEIGSLVEELAQETNCLIIYNDDIKDKDLRDISITHTEGKLETDVKAGQTLTIGGEKFRITSVGDIAQKTLREIGHCTIKFDGEYKVNLPGEMHVEGEIPEVKVGDIISIY